MKDENGIEIFCKNCNDDVAINCPHYNPDNPDEDFGCVVSGGFVPSYDALFARIKELQDELYADKYNYESWEEIKEEHQKLEATISDLKQKLANLEGEDLKEELRFTIEEIDFIKKAISMAILDCETNPPKPSDENLKLMWSIKFKCDGLLKERKD